MGRGRLLPASESLIEQFRSGSAFSKVPNDRLSGKVKPNCLKGRVIGNCNSRRQDVSALIDRLADGLSAIRTFQSVTTGLPVIHPEPSSHGRSRDCDRPLVNGEGDGSNELHMSSV